ncbi:DUF3141 domain-containing protein, partial [Psychrobacter sp. SIMBA_152]
WFAWLGPAADAVRANRHGEGDNPLRQFERYGSEIISASLDFYRAMRDAATESGFFSLYGNMSSVYQGGRNDARQQAVQMK